MRNKEKDKEWRLKNREHLLEYCKKWNRENKEHLIKYRQENKDKLTELSIKWQREHKDKVKIATKKWRQKDSSKEILKKINKKWRDANKEEHLSRRRIREKEKRESDPIYKFSLKIRSLISGSFHRKSVSKIKTLHTEQILGCSIDFFREYIMNMCPKDVKLSNFSKFGYHLDHIIPVSLAKTEEDVIKLCHYTNFQPLWWSDNLSKSNKQI